MSDSAPDQAAPSSDEQTGQPEHVPQGREAPLLDLPETTLLDLNAAPTSGTAGADEAPPVPPSEIANLLSALEKAVRARRLYETNNPTYRSFLKGLASLFDRVWDWIPALSVVVDDGVFRWHGSDFRVGEGRENLAFVFYKDGIRFLTFLPGFEDEVERFVEVVATARQVGQQGDDDLVTLLWGQEFASFQYSYVDALAEGLTLPGASTMRVSRIGPARVEQDLAGADRDPVPPAVQNGQPPVAASIAAEDFEETLYFLDATELDVLRAEVEKEWQRDTKEAVLSALFDRMEDRIPERQVEIVHILRQLLPVLLHRGDLHAVSRIITEIHQLLEKEEFGETVRVEARSLFAELSDPAILSQLLRSLEEGAIEPTGEELSVFLTHLGGDALPTLLRALETSEAQLLRDQLRGPVEALAQQHPGEVVKLIGGDDPVLCASAVRLAGQLRMPEACGALGRLLDRPDTNLRRSAVEALVGLGSVLSLEAVQQALADEDRDIRIAAVRGLAALRYQPARARLTDLIQGRALRDADLTERIAFFEAFGSVANAEGVEMLDKLLNGKRLFGKTDPELRACAAMALGRVNLPGARDSLMRARNDEQPVVRSAVTQALREGRGR